MTNRLYYQDQNITDFKTEIIATKKIDCKYHLLLNETAFYPGGGGQPADKGSLNDLEVLGVYEKENKIYHILEKKPTTSRVHGLVDVEFRQEIMQQHLGQHLLSAVAHHEFQANTIGFHLSEDSLTIDLDQKLNNKQLKIIETKANKIIWQNRAVKIYYPDSKEIAKLPIRKEPSVDNNIRIVEIDNYDYSPCGGLHPNTTGKIGLIKIISFSNYKQGIRIDFVCGKRALTDYRQTNNIINQLKDQLSLPKEKITKKILKLIDYNKSLEKNCTDLKSALRKYQSQEYINQAEKIGQYLIIKKTFTAKDNFEPDEINYLGKEITNKDNIIFICAWKNDNMVRFFFYRSDNLKKFDMNHLCQQALKITGGGGGGSAIAAQGGGGNPAQTEKALSHIKETILNHIEKVGF